MKWFGNRQVMGGAFGVALVILCFVQVISYRSAVEWTEGARARRHGRNVFIRLEFLLNALKDTETGQRGYLITGEQNYLEPYREGVERVGRTLDELRRLTIGDPDEQRSLQGLEPVVAAKLAELEKTIELRGQKGFEAAQAVVLTGEGKAWMDEIRKVTAVMEGREEERLRHLDEEVEASSRRTIRVLLAGGALSFALLLSTFYLLNREIAERKRGEKKVQILNEHFEGANRELEAFTYSVAHDLRAPLRHIDGFSKLVLKEHSQGLSEEGRRYLARIREGALRMGSLIDDLLNLARVGRK